MDDADVDVLVYPTWNSPPLKVGDSFTGYYDGNNSPMISPQTGSPSISVPMGVNSERLGSAMAVAGMGVGRDPSCVHCT